jgi:hypothetical protein
MTMKPNLLLSPDPAAGAAPETDAAKAARLERENAALKQQIQGGEKIETAVRAKMADGLTRTQAEAAVRNQVKFAAAKAEAAKAKKK